MFGEKIVGFVPFSFPFGRSLPNFLNIVSNLHVHDAYQIWSGLVVVSRSGYIGLIPERLILRIPKVITIGAYRLKAYKNN